MQAADDEDVIRVNTDLLLFPVRIRDKKGVAVAGLTDQDLLLKDEDQVTTGLYFTPGADRVALLFALDQSGSLRQIISQQREAALALFSRFGERSMAETLLGAGAKVNVVDEYGETPLTLAAANGDAATAALGRVAGARVVHEDRAHRPRDAVESIAQQRKRERNVMDYDDLLGQWARLLDDGTAAGALVVAIRESL